MVIEASAVRSRRGLFIFSCQKCVDGRTREAARQLIEQLRIEPARHAAGQADLASDARPRGKSSRACRLRRSVAWLRSGSCASAPSFPQTLFALRLQPTSGLRCLGRPVVDESIWLGIDLPDPAFRYLQMAGEGTRAEEFLLLHMGSASDSLVTCETRIHEL